MPTASEMVAAAIEGWGSFCLWLDRVTGRAR